jgi:hypothetical protein
MAPQSQPVLGCGVRSARSVKSALHWLTAFETGIMIGGRRC